MFLTYHSSHRLHVIKLDYFLSDYTEQQTSWMMQSAYSLFDFSILRDPNRITSFQICQAMRLMVDRFFVFCEVEYAVHTTLS